MPTSPRRRGGQMATQALLMLPVLLGFAALAIDRGILQVRDQEAQSAADAVAHAAAASLDGSSDGLERARSAAASVASQNRVGRVEVALDATTGTIAEVELGQWTGDQFVPGTTDPGAVVAARARVTRLNIPTLFGYPAFGIRTMAVTGEAIVLAGGAGEIECPLPLAIPSCALPETDGLCGADLILNADGDDSAGWALLGSDRPSASTIRAGIESCGMSTVTTADVVTLNNGAVNGALTALADAVSGSTQLWDEAEFGALPAQSARSGVTRYGHVVDSWIIVFDDPTGCASTSYNGTSMAVEGFVRAVVYDVDTSGPVGAREIRARLGCAIDRSASGGGSYFGTTVPPRFVSESAQ